MASFVHDGYTRSGFIKGDDPGPDMESMFDALKFEYRVATRAEVSELDYNVQTAAMKVGETNSGVTVKDMEMIASKFVADHLKSWDLKMDTGTPVMIVPDVMLRLHPKLYDRLYGIVRNEKRNDKRPKEAEPLTDAEMQKN